MRSERLSSSRLADALADTDTHRRITPHVRSGRAVVTNNLVSPVEPFDRFRGILTNESRRRSGGKIRHVRLRDACLVTLDSIEAYLDLPL